MRLAMRVVARAPRLRRSLPLALRPPAARCASARAGAGRAPSFMKGIAPPISFSIAATALASFAPATMRDRGTGAAGAAGAADAMHIIVGMHRNVEIIDVAHVGNIEAARCDVGGDQERDLALAELLERRRARRLVHVAMQRQHRKAVPKQRAMQRRHIALAIAEDDGVLQAFRRADQAAQRVALVMAPRGRT